MTSAQAINIDFNKFPFLYFDDFYLRQIQSSDAYAYYKYMSDQKVKSQLGIGIVPASLEQSRFFVDYYSVYSSNRLFWAIAEKDTDLLIGTVGFNYMNLLQKKADMGFDLNSKYWGKKIMKRSIEKVLSFAKSAGIVRLQSVTLVNNEKAIKLLEGLGFEKEGILRKYEVNENDQDSLMYSIILNAK